MAETLGCSAGCKRQVRDADAALETAWDYLPIANRWRCPNCTNDLRLANQRLAPVPTINDQPD